MQQNSAVDGKCSEVPQYLISACTHQYIAKSGKDKAEDGAAPSIHSNTHNPRDGGGQSVAANNNYPVGGRE